MSKKIISIVMSLIVVASLAGCGKNDSKKNTDTTSSTESTSSEDDSLTGIWATNYNLEEMKKLYEEKLKKIKEITEEAGIKAEEDERITNEDKLFISDKALYFDNNGAQENKIENFYFGQRLYGEDSSKGLIELKIILNFDSDKAINNNFDIKDTTMAKYIAAFTGQGTRDYSSINKEIIDKLKKGDSEVKITDTVDGLKEEIIVTKDTFFYKLSTKKYDFRNSDNPVVGTTTTESGTESKTDDNKQ